MVKPIVIVADPHLGKFWKSNNSVFSKSKKLIASFIHNLEEAARSFSCKPDLIIAGDVFDSISANVEMLVYIKKKLNKVFDLYDEIHIIAGNHETFIDKNGVQQTLLYIALDTNRVHLYTDGVSSQVLQGLNFIFVPHQMEIESIFQDEVPKYLKPDVPNVILAHTTPKEIFSFCKYSLNDILDSYDQRVDYVLLGHYHKPYDYTYKGTEVKSIGNMYYLTITDIQENSQKRYLVFNEDGRLEERSLILPAIHKFEVMDQKMFDSVIVDQIHQLIPEPQEDTSIIYLVSNNIIDYSTLTFEGYDVYFNLIENAEENLITLKESIADDVDIQTNRSLIDRWNTYIDFISSNLTSNEVDTINWLFTNRNSLDINPSDIMDHLKGGTEV